MLSLSCLSNAAIAEEHSIYQQRQFTYPNGLTKAVILSYDDGLEQDIRLIEILNKYGLKGTFNLNSAYFDTPAPWLKKFTQKEGKYVPKNRISNIYQGHEIASHTTTHPHLTDKMTAFILDAVNKDILALEQHSTTQITSFAYPFGAYDQNAVLTLKTTALTNARTIKDTQQFSLPDDYFIWHPTTHHKKAVQTLSKFIDSVPKQPTLFYMWGHSWEFDQNLADNNWQYIEEVCHKLGGHSDIWYVGAAEFVDYITAVKGLTYVSGKAQNNSNIDVWIKANGKVIRLQATGL